MLTFSKEQAIEASHQFLSGLARYAQCFFDDGAGARLLRVESLQPEFEFCQLENSTAKHSDSAQFDEFAFPQTVALLYDFAASGLGTSMEEIENAISEGWSFHEVFSYGGCFLDRLGQDLIDPTAIEIIEMVYKAAEARAVIIGHDLYAGNDIRLDCLAALAGVSVKTLRNAASNAGPNQLKTMKKGAATVISAPVALAWLRSRPGFKESQVGEAPNLESYTDINQLGLHLATICNQANMSVESLVSDLQLSQQQALDLQTLIDKKNTDLLEHLNAPIFAAIGKYLKFQNPIDFALEAIRVVAAHNGVSLAKQQLK